MNGIKSIQELVHLKELEILKAVEESARQQEMELRRIQGSLMEALRVVNRLLESDQTLSEPAAVAPSVAAASVPARPAPPAPEIPGKYEGYPRVTAVRMAGTQFP